MVKAVLINILERAMQTDDSQKNTAKCSVKLLRYTLQNTKRYSETSWKVFCKTDEKFSAKIVKIGSAKMAIRGPQKYCEMFCKNTERCSREILRCLLQKKKKVFCKISEGSFTPWHKMNNFRVKAQGLSLFSKCWKLICTFLILNKTWKR